MATFQRLAVTGAWFLLPVALLGALVWGTGWLHQVSGTMPNAPSESEIVLSFGLGRDPLIGSTLADVCSRKRDSGTDTGGVERGGARINASLIENARGRCVKTSRRPTRRAAGSVDRPAILATTVLRDLAPCAQPESPDETPPGDLSERFPANQVTATSELVGATGLRVIVSVNPTSPVDAPDGVFCTVVITERAAGPYTRTLVAVRVQSRGGSSLALVVLYLLIGAVAGIVIRFLNDPTSKLIGPYRRLRAARRWVESLTDADERSKFELRIGEVEAAIWYLDPVAADEALKVIEEARVADPQTWATLLSRSGTFGGGSRRPLRPTDDTPSLQPAFFALLRNNWWIALIGVAVAVVATGVWTLYAQSPSFDGGLDDWVKLAIFGLGAQITTGTLAEALGKLQPTARSTQI